MTVEMKKYKLGDIADFDKKTLSKKTLWMLLSIWIQVV